MTLHRISPLSPILCDRDSYLFHGETIDALVAGSEDEAYRIADDLNSDNARFGVVRFNPVEGICRDVTADFLPDEPEDLEDYPGFDRACSAADFAYQLRREH